MGKNKRGDDDEVFDPADFVIPPAPLEDDDMIDAGRLSWSGRRSTRRAVEAAATVEELSALPRGALKAFDRVRARQPGREPLNVARERWVQTQSEGYSSEDLQDSTPSISDARVVDKFANALARSKAQLRKRLGF